LKNIYINHYGRAEVGGLIKRGDDSWVQWLSEYCR